MKRHLVRVVVNCSPKTHIFKSKKKMHEFIKKFLKKYPNMQMDGYWIDLAVSDIHGIILDDNEIL